MGEFRPHLKQEGKRIPTHIILFIYYPAIMSHQDFDIVQAKGGTRFLYKNEHGGAAWSRASAPRPNSLPERRTAFGPIIGWRSRCIMHLPKGGPERSGMPSRASTSYQGGSPGHVSK